jgi:predicted dienelactone hydrolase
MPPYRISNAARADIVDILRLSQTQFGDQARQRYQALILAALQAIADTPYRIGSHDRDELAPGLRSLKAGLAGDLRDQRVTAVVSLDLGLSRGMTDESLAALPVPVLVIAAGAPSVELPAQLESANLATRLPQVSSRYVEISDASHFSFLPICKPGAVALLEEDIPGDGIICGDGDNARPREVIQQQVTSLITEFLTQSANNIVEL